MAVLSTHWAQGDNNIEFVVLDKDEDVINNINSNNEENQRELYFWEQGVDDLLDQAMEVNGNLRFSSNIDAELDNCRVIFIAVDIPPKAGPKQVKSDLNVDNFEDAIVAVLSSIQRAAPAFASKYVAVKSTLPIDFKDDLRERLSRHAYFNGLHVTANPEFFSTGTAVDDLSNPPKIVLGNFHRDGQHIFRDLYLPVVLNNPQRIEMIDTVSSAEVGKLLSNASIAAQLTIINIGSTICERVTCNYEDVMRSYTANPRVNDFFIDSRAGYGGLGLNKDVSYLCFLCQNAGLKNEMGFFKSLIQMRLKKMDDLVNTILSKVGSSKLVTIYGFANKIDTDDIRESPAIYICKALLHRHVHDVRLTIYDPLVPDETIIGSFPDKVKNRVTVSDDAEQASVNANALIFLLEYPEFRAMLDQPQQLLPAMRSPRIIFDCCDLFDNAVDLNVFENPYPGSTVYRLGKPI